MRTLFLTGVLAISFLTPLIAQVGINTDGSQPHPSAMLDVKSSFKGFLPPRMTTVQRNTIDSPADGLLIFNLTTGCIDYFLGGSWKSFCGVSEPAFQCGMKMSDSRDGKMYNTVKIGTQCWMAQNLNVGTLINGADDQADNMVIEKYCYNDLESNCCLYGGLYQWAEMVQYLNGASNSVGWNPLPAGPVQGICPEGWHLPCLADFGELISYAGGFTEGGTLKETGSSHWALLNSGATNSTGFTALPAGFRNTDGNFSNITNDAYFLSSSESSSAFAENWYLDSSDNLVYHGYKIKSAGFSVRCIKQ